MTSPSNVRTVRVCGQSFRVATRESTGQAPPLLLINGLGCSIEVLTPLLEALDPSTGYVCFDAPGVGGSPRARLPYRLSGLSYRLGKLLGELDIPEVDVLGASWGGALAQQFAVQHPRRCRRLILVSTGAAPILRPSLATLREAVSPRRFDNAHIAAQFYGGKVQRDPSLLRHLQREIPNRGGERFQTLAVLGWTSLLYLRWVRQPTLVLHGDEDNLVPMLNARLLRRLLPNAQLHVFHDGHIGLITSAAEIAPVIEAFRSGAQTEPTAAAQQDRSEEPAMPERIADRLFSDLALPDETKKIREQVREVAERDVAPHAREIGQRDESVESFPWEPFRALGAAGLFRIPLGPEHGAGLEYRALAAATAVEELAYVCSSVATVYDGQCILAGRTVENGTQRIRDEYLAPLSGGDLVASFATTEPEASTDLSPERLQTMAERTPSGWVVNGRKRFITNSPVADIVVALCRTGKQASFMLIPLKDTPGVTVGRPDLKLGQRGQLTADITFEGVELPEDHLLGDEGDGLRLALSILTYSRIAIGAAGVGLAQAALDLAVEHLSTRRAFGKRLGEFQHWQFRMAEHATAIENGRSLYQKAARRIDGGAPVPEPEAAMAKWYCTSMAVDVARDALQALGGYGYMRELAATGQGSKLEEIYRDAKVGEIYEGANEIQKWIIARSIFGRDITG